MSPSPASPSRPGLMIVVIGLAAAAIAVTAADVQLVLARSAALSAAPPAPDARQPLELQVTLATLRVVLDLVLFAALGLVAARRPGPAEGMGVDLAVSLLAASSPATLQMHLVAVVAARLGLRFVERVAGLGMRGGADVAFLLIAAAVAIFGLMWASWPSRRSHPAL